MDYHADRFEDCSILFTEGSRLVAALPANRQEDTLVSHAGLTFGGIVTDDQMTVGRMLAIFDLLMDYLCRQGIRRLIYKPVPHIFHRLPAEEDLYCIFIKQGSLIRRDLSTVIDLRSRIPYSKGRKWSINKAKKAGLTAKQSDDFETFMAIEEHVLRKYHGTTPVHTAAEIRLLAERFPHNIQLFAASKDSTMLAGVIVYIYGSVVHTQYIASTDEGRETGASDFVLDHLIRNVYPEKTYFDFGISTESSGRYLNSGLALYKENFGGRSVVYDCYEIAI